MAKVSVVCANASSQAHSRVDEALLGKKARCKHCGTTFILTRTDATAPAIPQAGWQAGDVILDLYEVKGVLGEGGMGTVYHVHHKGWNRDLAVKSPRRDLLARPGAVEDFEREAETWVNLYGGLPPPARHPRLRRLRLAAPRRRPPRA